MKNGENYADPTASQAMGKLIYDEKIDNKAKELIKAIILVCNTSGFDLKNRIEIEHRKSKKRYK